VSLAGWVSYGNGTEIFLALHMPRATSHDETRGPLTVCFDRRRAWRIARAAIDLHLSCQEPRYPRRQHMYGLSPCTEARW